MGTDKQMLHNTYSSFKLEGILEAEEIIDDKPHAPSGAHVIRDSDGVKHIIDEAMYELDSEYFGKRIEYECKGHRELDEGKGDLNQIFPLEIIKIYDENNKCVLDLNTHEFYLERKRKRKLATQKK